MNFSKMSDQVCPGVLMEKSVASIMYGTIRSKEFCSKSIQKISVGTSLAVQWLRLCASNAEGAGFHPWLGN